MKKLLICLPVLLSIACASTAAFAATDVEKSLSANYPQFKFDSVAPSPVAGLYEVVAGRQILYYAPQEGIIVSGQMFDKTDRNLTAERVEELRAKAEQEIVLKAKDLPLEKAVKTGDGPHTVIEFTDPDCPFCRKAAEFFEKRSDVTKYTFFLPLNIHPDARNKVRYILCQEDRGKAFREVMKGKLDKEKYETCSRSEVEELQKIYEAEAGRLGISGTPFFIVDGTAVSGADVNKLAFLLSMKVAQDR